MVCFLASRNISTAPEEKTICLQLTSMERSIVNLFIGKSVAAVAIKISDRCVKMKLPDGHTVDILAPVFEEIQHWLQVGIDAPESGGYIVGYQHKWTGNISLEKVSTPGKDDKRSRVGFIMRDVVHRFFLQKASKEYSSYMGVWHTHPQDIPTPSFIDWDDWYDTMKVDRTAASYAFFIIAGRIGARVWVGDYRTGEIVEIFECEKHGELYLT